MKPYQHRPLKQSRDGRPWIRLFDILPGEKDTPVCLNLLPVRLGTDQYEALSYHWGDPESRIPIYCDDGVLEVTENLHAALLRLRRRRHRRRVWVDSICINQSDTDERNLQVGLMWAIYSKAQRVVIWLGDSVQGDDSETAMTVIPLLAELSDATRHKEDGELESARLQRPEILQLTERGTREPYLRAVTNLLQRPWFSRLWVIQELAVSPNAVVLCGAYVLPWATFIEAALYVHGYPDMERSGFTPALEPVFGIELARAAFMNQISQDLLTLLFHYRHFQVTDPRDKIYALLGLLPGNVVQDLNLYPDYGLPTAELFKHVAIGIISTSSHLDLLCKLKAREDDNRAHSGVEGLPSWVPDWSSSSDLIPLTGIRYNGEYVHNYDASRNSLPSPLFAEGGTALYLSGFIVDKIVKVGAKMEYEHHQRRHSRFDWAYSTAANTTQRHAHINWESIAQLKSKKAYPTGENVIDAYYQTLVADSYAASYSDRHMFERWDEFSQWFRWIYEGGYDQYPFATFFATLLVWSFLFVYSFTQATDPDFPLTQSLASKMVEATSHRKFIRTRNGYMGLAPPNVRAGDFIGLVKGGRVPLIIRSDGSCWKFIGDSYIHGMMQGEVWNENLCGTMRII